MTFKPTRGKDKMNKEMAEKLLGLVIDVLNKYGIKYWLDYGSMLGAVREHDFVDTDFDIDISYHATQDIWPALNELKDMGYEFTPDYVESTIPNKDVFKNERVKLLRKANIMLEGKHGFAKLEIVPSYYHEKNQKYYKLTGQDDFFLKGAGVPADLMGELSTVSFRGLHVSIQSNAERLLEFHYGEGWRTPDPNSISKTYREPFETIFIGDLQY